MKQKLLTRLMLAGLAGAAFTGAHAGQIQASSVSIAREAISSDTQAIVAPSISYRFAGDVDARVQAQTFQVQFTLEQGTWAAAPSANAYSISDGVTGQIQDQSAVAPGANSVATGVAANSSYTVVATNLSADKKTLWVTFTVNQGATALVKQPIISLNVTQNTVAGTPGTASTTRATVNGLKTVVGDIVSDYTSSKICAAVKTARVRVDHYVGLQNPAALATEANATADEHKRDSATNSGTLITFPTNLGILFATSTGTLKLQSGGNATFDSTGAGSVVASAAPSTAGTAHVAAAGAGQLTARLGIARLAQTAVGLDSNLTNVYALNNGGNGLTVAANAAANNGEVEIRSFDLQVSATNGFSVGGSLFAAVAGNNCATPIAGSSVAITSANAAGPIVVPVTSAAAFGNSGTDPVEICYTVTGTSTVPSSAFTVVGTLTKSAETANNSFAEQNNVCNGTLYSLGGGLKIDVRNYASSAEKSGYQSVLRFINNSDVVTADVFAQVIHQDGRLGNWAKLTDLKPRASLNMTAAQIDARLAAGTAPDAGAANNGAAAAADQAATATSTNTAPRLRITSNSGNSLRVQNYLFNAATGQILEASGSQAVDFNGNNDRAPGSDGQYISQDANSGINLK